ncbi:hypothetical protein [Chitinophaga caseinilytica]|uniref:Uncharacterized protein n=1 Tax=Chitinophaga caseinilytica TaxID=2267521 RepID=A0ABZ2Z2Q0_9BACT
MQPQPTIEALAQDTLPFGETLAGNVAARLEEGCSIGYRRPGYCGMGMEKDDFGDFLYGELYKGVMQRPRRFRTREEFIGWLAEQSTATMAQLDHDDPRKRGVLVITRQRLLAFTE